MRRQLRNLRFWILVFALGWLTMVVLLISHTPPPGAASPDELAVRVADALNTHDSKKLQPLVSVGAEEIAKATTDRFADSHVSSARFSGGAVVVDYVRADGTPASFTMLAEENDGRWQLTPLATP